jgi:hypothetical protein
MANLISADEIMFDAFEPKMKARYIMYIEGIPSMLLKKAARPKISFDDVTLDHINIQRKLKGKGKWEDVSVTLYDPIVPSGAQAVMEWVRLSHESVTGRAGYAEFYKKDVKINMLGPVGDIVEEWTMKGCYIKEADFGEVDWTSQADVAEITMSLRYDYAILEF